MRASRLLSILTTLQARGRATAPELAAACEVSVRTIYRDIDALSAAGAPVYAERGPEGGYRLLDGYRVRLNGLSRAEAESLFLAGLPGPAAQLGLGAAMAAAELKLLAALPADQRKSADLMRARFHLDAPSWFDALEDPPALKDLAAAVWREAPVRIRYDRRSRSVERRLQPLGLVLKSGVWYLVARAGDDMRTYRVARILELTVLEETFVPPPGFDLAAWWTEHAERFEESLYADEARMRVSPAGLFRLRHLAPARGRTVERSAGPPGADGWREVSLPFESLAEGTAVVLRLGADAEVLAPPALRTAVARAVEGMHRIYALSEHAAPRS